MLWSLQTQKIQVQMKTKVSSTTLRLKGTLSLVIGRRGGLMVSALISGSSSPGSSPGRGHCVVFLGKTLNSHSASLHPGVQMGTSEFNAGDNPAMDWHPIQGGLEKLLVASCYRNRS